ncbi:MAG TPA: metallophosphoesterase [Thermoanaerobaculia bacterium]|nr:metallophosphoesterase [Thermoanaerobaculia bacterium]
MSSRARPLLLSLFFFATPLLAATERVVAVGDIHGEYEGFVSILQKAGVIDQKLRWSGRRTTLVQTGDYLDRGPDVRKVMDLLMSLETRAARARGKAIVLLGNHELMNLTANLQDVNPAAYAAFADRRSERRRTAGYREYVELHRRLSDRYGREPWRLLSEVTWMDDHPPGSIEFQEAISRNGKYGRWLRSKRVIARVNDTVFVHGGISPKATQPTLDSINDQARIEIEAFDRIREYLIAHKLILPFFTFNEISNVVQLESLRTEGVSDEMGRILAAFRSVQNWMIYDPDGPLWFRGFGDWSDEEGEQYLGELLERFDARRFVVGHTIPADASRILPRFGGRVFLIDTGMLRNYAKNGRPAALEITGNTYAAIYESGRVVLSASSPQSSRRQRPADASRFVLASLRHQESSGAVAVVWRGPNGTTLPFQTSEEVAEFLRSAKLLKVDRKKLYGVTRPQKVLVQNGAVRSHAVFRAYHREEENSYWESGKFTIFLRDTYLSEIAAYELTRLLGLDTVPPAVPWQLKGRKGSLQLWIENASPGWHPSGTVQPSDPELWAREEDKMRVFDALIGNVDRHDGNVLVDQTGKIWWIDHSRSFGRETDLIAPDSIKRCERKLWESLKAVDPKAVAERLAPYMSVKEVDALLERRQRLIDLIEQRIADQGEAAVLYTIAPGEGPLRSVPRPPMAPRTSFRAPEAFISAHR